MERLRFIVNCFTRLRYCTPQGDLDLTSKGAPGTQPAGLLPWFDGSGARQLPSCTSSSATGPPWARSRAKTSIRWIPAVSGVEGLSALRLDGDDSGSWYCVDCPGAQRPAATEAQYFRICPWPTSTPIMNLRLDGKWALVCGASQGIGAAAARALAELGADVTLVARSKTSLRRPSSSSPPAAASGMAISLPISTSRRRSRQHLDQWLKNHPQAHILVNNTGGPPGGPRMLPSRRITRQPSTASALWTRYWCRRCCPACSRSGYGRIINVISTSVKEPIKGLGVSNTVRWAVASWAKTLAGELGPSASPSTTCCRASPAPTAHRQPVQGTRRERTPLRG